MWIAILLTALSLAVTSAVYIARCFGRFDVIKRVSGGRKSLRIMLGLVPVVGFAVYAIFDIVNSVIVLIHLAAFFLIDNSMILRVGMEAALTVPVATQVHSSRFIRLFKNMR